MTRVVLLGASNLALGFPLIVRQLFGGLARPLEIFAACGHGRSYCTWSRVLFRALPGIDRCGLWATRADDRELASRTLALLTDVGNDLIYGSSPVVIARRVETCLAMLATQRAELVLTRLPLASVERLSALRYHATKAIFFPRTRGAWPDMLKKARELDVSLEKLPPGIRPASSNNHSTGTGSIPCTFAAAGASSPGRRFFSLALDSVPLARTTVSGWPTSSACAWPLPPNAASSAAATCERNPPSNWATLRSGSISDLSGLIP